MSRITLKNFPVTPQTLLTTENLCFKQKSNFSEKVLPPSVMVLCVGMVWCAYSCLSYPVQGHCRHRQELSPGQECKLHGW